MLAVAPRECRIDEAFCRALNQCLEIGVARYDMLVSTGSFTNGQMGAGCLPKLLALPVPGGRLICKVHRDVWGEVGLGTGLQALTDANAATVCSCESIACSQTRTSSEEEDEDYHCLIGDSLERVFIHSARPGVSGCR